MSENTCASDACKQKEFVMENIGQEERVRDSHLALFQNIFCSQISFEENTV